jgi:flagellar protein FlaG
MNSSAAITATTADQSVGQSPFAPNSQGEISSPAAIVQDQTQVTNPADLRLVIEEDKAAGTFVYKTIDWRTGEVVQQLPREQVLRMREAQNYAVGQVLATKV